MTECVDFKRLLTAAATIGLATLLILIQYRDLQLGLNYDTLTAAGTVAAVLWVFWIIFRNWLWKIPLLQGWLVKIPNLGGDWTGTLQSTWVNPVTKKGIGPINLKAKIKQNLTAVSIDFESDEMESQSLSASISCDEHRRTAELKYVYQSEPSAAVRNRSEIHYGAAKLIVKKSKKQIQLKGSYWTDRKTTGGIVLTRVE